MERPTRIIIITTAAATALTIAIAGVAAATRADDAEPPITGVALERASEAALELTGGGRVTETELGDEDSYYEVEVTLDDGRQVDVQLDREFAVVASSADVEDDR
jgi:uncharacterized membrane protein YkoI